MTLSHDQIKITKFLKIYFIGQPSFASSTLDGSAALSAFGRNTNKEKQVAVPGVGVAAQLPSGELRVKYDDGCQLWVDGKHHVRFQYVDGRTVNYTDTDDIPKSIVTKMQMVPKVVKWLNTPAPSGGADVNKQYHYLR